MRPADGAATDWTQQQKLEAASRIGKEVWLNGKGSWTPTLWGIVEDEVSILVDSTKHVIQRIRLADGVSWDGSKFGYKTGAFTLDARSNAVKWAQYSQCLSEEEFRELLGKAREKGWPVL
jgi:hypothetical protein